MDVKISGKGIDLGESLREYARNEMENLIDKYLQEDIDSSVLISKDNRLFETEVCLRLNKGFVIKSHGASDDPYRSVSMALEILEERIKRHKNRIMDKARRSEWGKGVDAIKYVVERKESSNSDEEHLVIAESEGAILSLSVSEAVMKLDLTEMPVVMFKNADSGRINVVYKRPDGHIGWIDYQG